MRTLVVVTLAVGLLAGCGDDDDVPDVTHEAVACGEQQTIPPNGDLSAVAASWVECMEAAGWQCSEASCVKDNVTFDNPFL